MLKQPLQIKHVKPRLLGHWGTSPGPNFVYVHLNRIIREHDLAPFDMTVINDIDPFHLVMDVMDRVPVLGARAVEVTGLMREKLAEDRPYIRLHGDDMPEIRD